MKPLNSIISEVKSESPQIRTFRLDIDLDPAPGQYVMVWIRGVDEIPMSFSGPDTITVQCVGEATQSLFEMDHNRSVCGRGYTIIVRDGRREQHWPARPIRKRLCSEGREGSAYRRRRGNGSAGVFG